MSQTRDITSITNSMILAMDKVARQNDMGKEWLDDNDTNRPLIKAMVAKIVADRFAYDTVDDTSDHDHYAASVVAGE